MRTAGGRDRSFTEYGAPSLHTSAGLFSALVLVHELQGHGVRLLIVGGGDSSAAYAYVAAVAWGAWIGLTRVYLGVHSPLDLILGGVVGASTFGLWREAADAHLSFLVGPCSTFPFSINLESLDSSCHGVEAAHEWTYRTLSSSLYRGGSVIAAHAACLLRYPSPLHRTESFEHATTFLGAWGGFPMALHATGGIRAASATVHQTLIRLWRDGGGGGDDDGLRGAYVRGPKANEASLGAWIGEAMASLAGGIFSSPMARRAFHVIVGSLLVVIARSMAKVMSIPIFRSAWLCLCSVLVFSNCMGRLSPALTPIVLIYNQAALTPLVIGVIRALPRSLRLRLQPPLAHEDLAGEHGEEECLANGEPLRPTSTSTSSPNMVEDQPLRKGKQQPATRLRARKGGPGDKNGSAGNSLGRGEGRAAAAVVPLVLSSAGPAASSTAVHRVTEKDMGPALRPDGYPCDADAIRRYIVYCLVVVTVILWHELAIAVGLVDH